MTRAGASEFVRANQAKGERVCVVVAAAPNGDVSFAGGSALVPLTRLMQRLRKPALASSLALAMACTRPLAGEPPMPEPTPAPTEAEESEPATETETVSAPEAAEPAGAEQDSPASHEAR